MSNKDNGPGVPKHVAIIMDGNGRWATRRGMPRTMGHKQGAEAARRVVRAAADRGIECLTLFGFSSENWNRPEQEVKDLMRLLRHYLRSETAELHKNNVRLRIIGDRSAFDRDIVELIDKTEDLMAGHTGLKLTIALSYSGRTDILQAAEKVSKRTIERGEAFTSAELAEVFPDFLMTKDFPDPDLLIRTSGEKRISNFLLWQCAYSELYFTPVLWPDFSRAHLEEALEEYENRDRRFGSVKVSEGLK